MRPLVWDANSPLIEALHHYDYEIARRALEDHPAPKEETTMTATHTTPSYDLQPHVEAHARYLAEHGEQITEQGRQISTLLGVHTGLEARVSDLEGLALAQADMITELQEKLGELTAPRPKPADLTNDRIVAYLRDSVPGVWMTPGSVAVNLGLDGKSVSGRLDRMSRGEHPEVERKGGKGTGAGHPLYRVVPPPKPQPEA